MLRKIAGILITICLLTGCTAGQSNAERTNLDATDSGNALNLGTVVQGEGDLFYYKGIDPASNSISIRQASNEAVVTVFQPDKIFIPLLYANGWLYCEYGDHLELVRIDTNNGVMEPLDKVVELIVVFDNKLYYIDRTDLALCAMDFDGSGQEQIPSRRARNLFLSGGKLYYTDGQYVYQRTSSTEEKIVADIPDMGTFCVLNQNIYYARNSDFCLYQKSFDSSSEKEITRSPVYSLNVLNNEVLFSVQGSESVDLYSYDPEKEKTTLLKKSVAQGIGVANGNVYCMMRSGVFCVNTGRYLDKD